MSDAITSPTPTIAQEALPLDRVYKFVIVLPKRRGRRRPLIICGNRCPVQAGTALVQSALRIGRMAL
ncbi:MAG: hypothetical protein KJZ86_24125 [Caldilineaceae bacterium]|nr:hypothetical protein [Caldilineaceae bacterium]